MFAGFQHRDLQESNFVFHVNSGYVRQMNPVVLVQFGGKCDWWWLPWQQRQLLLHEILWCWVLENKTYPISLKSFKIGILINHIFTRHWIMWPTVINTFHLPLLNERCVPSWAEIRVELDSLFINRSFCLSSNNSDISQTLCTVVCVICTLISGGILDIITEINKLPYWLKFMPNDSRPHLNHNSDRKIQQNWAKYSNTLNL